MTKKLRPLELYEGFRRFVQIHELFGRGSRILAAVSGGIDSVVLLDLLASLSAEWDLKVVILHVNHNCAGASRMPTKNLSHRWRSITAFPCTRRVLRQRVKLHERDFQFRKRQGISAMLSFRKRWLSSMETLSRRRTMRTTMPRRCS